MESPTREIFWQISYHWPFYLAALITLLIFSLGVIKSLLYILKGATLPGRSLKRLGAWAFIKELGPHRNLAGDNPARQWHLLIFYGFLALIFVTCYLVVAHYGFPNIFTGRPYLFLSFFADIAGGCLLLGLVIAIRASIHDLKTEPVDKEKIIGKIYLFIFLGAACVTGFLLEGLRIQLQKDPSAAWSPLGFLLAQLFIPLSNDNGLDYFKGLWWMHSLLALGFLAWIPFSSGLRHMLFIPFNRSLMPLKSQSLSFHHDLKALRLAAPAFDSLRLGLETAADLTAKQRLGVLSCMSCGRCERLCPAFQTGQPLSPKQYLKELQNNDAVSSSSLWSCRLCGACEELCPAGLEHIWQMIELRRAEVLNHGRLPAEGATALRNLGHSGNPYGVAAIDRAAWIKKERLPTTLKEGTDNAWLLWTGCFQPGDEQKPKVLSCLTALLKGLELPFFVLPEAVSCCGDPARILGEEDLFQETVKTQVKHIKESGTKKILVHCPHCYTVLKDIYPQYGADFSIIHTSELFQELIQQKQLTIKGLESADLKKLVYHDPCFLGRYQAIIQPPRKILADLPGLALHELPRHGQEGYCCGAGGGHFFMDLDIQQRPSSQRMEEILDQEAEILAVSCSFCFSMFDDALRRLPNPPDLQIADWLELLYEAADITPAK